MIKEQKSGHAIAFFAGHVFPGTWKSKQRGYGSAEHQNHQTCPGTEKCLCIGTCIIGVCVYFFSQTVLFVQLYTS